MHMEYPLISAEEGINIEQRVIDVLKERHLTITTAESCTGGLISARLVNVAGASEVFGRSFVTYANEAKEEELGVGHETLETYGAVSEQTVCQMAEGAARHAKADIGIAVSGVAGPDGGTERTPVGTVYIGIYYCQEVYWQRCHFTGDRTQVREQTVVNSLQFLLNVLE